VGLLQDGNVRFRIICPDSFNDLFEFHRSCRLLPF
jgi:hypothetical protein